MTSPTDNITHAEGDIVKGPLGLALWFALPGALQGIGLRWLTEWRDTPDAIALTIAMFLFVFGAAYFLTTKEGDRIRPLIFSLILGGITAGLTYLAQNTFGADGVHGDTIAVSLFSCSLICYIAVPFYRTVFERKLSVFNYKSLFEFGWNLPVIAATAALFTGAFWAVLAIWAALFDLIGIHFFRDLFFDDWFAVPATFSAGAVAIGIIREREGIILALRGILFALLKVLAPIFAFATILFSFAAFATGLDELWSGFSATTLMITAIAFAVIFVNAVLGDEGVPANPIQRWTVRLQAAVMPILAGFAVYGLVLRINEYGLTHERFFALLIVGVAAAYSVAYFITAVLPNRYGALRQLNILLAGAVFALAVLIQTPVLNAYKIAANAQFTRLVSGKIAAEDIDLGYLKYRAGKAGKQVLARIREDETLPNRDEIEIELARLDETKSVYDYNSNRRRDTAENEGVKLLDELIKDDKLELHYTTREALPEWFLSELGNQSYQLRQCRAKSAACLISGLTGFNAPDPQFIVVTSGNPSFIQMSFFAEQDSKPDAPQGWQFSTHSVHFNEASDADKDASRKAFITSLIRSKPAAKPTSVLSLTVDGTTYIPGMHDNNRALIKPPKSPEITEEEIVLPQD